MIFPFLISAIEIEKFLGQKLDYVIYNNKKPSKEALKKYKKENPELIELVNFVLEGENQ